MKRILIVEDESTLVEALKYTLEREGYLVDSAGDGVSGLEAFREVGADLVLLDLMLPEMDGLQVCRRIRAESAVPILMLTAKDSEIDEVLGLEMGADDYVTKPFNMRKLVARIRAILRRSEPGEGITAARAEWYGIRMDTDKHEVFLDGAVVELTPTEYRILELFMGSPEKVLTKEYILDRVWQGDFYGSAKTLNVHIRHLREKIEKDPARPDYVRTVRGMGYKLDKPGGEARE